VEAVRLLLLHVADASIIDHPLIFNLRIKKDTENTRVTTMLRLLEEHGYRMIWDPEIVHPVALLVVESGCAAGIGSPTITRLAVELEELTPGKLLLYRNRAVFLRDVEAI
jgi:hypothetical protein